MKVKQKVTYPDGRVEESEFDVPLQLSKAQITWVLIPKDEEPVAVKITEAGWKDNGMRTFHVLTEYGLHDEACKALKASYSYLNEEQLLERYPEAKEYFQSRSESGFESYEEWAYRQWTYHLDHPEKISWSRDEVVELIQRYSKEATGQPWFESSEEWVNKNV